MKQKYLISNARRILANILMVVMLLSLLPMNVHGESAIMCAIGSTEYATLEEALAAVQDGQTIRLLAEIQMYTPVIIDGINITFDLENDYNLIIDTGNINNSIALLVKNGGSVNLTGTGKLNVIGNLTGVRSIGASSLATVTNATAVGSSSHAVHAADRGKVLVLEDAVANGDYCNATFAYSGGSIVVEGNARSGWHSAYANNTGSSVHIKGSAIATQTYDSAGAYAGSNATIRVDQNVYGVGFGAFACGSSNIYIGGNAEATGVNGTGVAVEGYSNVTVDGLIAGTDYIRTGSVIKAKGDVAIPTNKQGYDTYNEELNTVWVRNTDPINYVCSLGEVSYTTLDEALAKVQNGQTIKLLTNINYNGGITISDKYISFDLNGFTLNVVNMATWSTGLSVKDGGLSLIGDGAFHVTGYSNGVMVVGENSDVTVTSAMGADSNTNVDSIGSYVMEGGKLTITGSSTGSRCGAYASEGGEIIIGGDAIATAPTPYDSFGVQAVSGGNITIAGNAIGEDRAIYAYNPGSKITVTNVISNSSGTNSSRIAVQVDNMAEAFILGDCTINSIYGTAIFVSSRGKVTIDGTIHHKGIYIKIYPDELNESEESRTIPTTKSGYYTYSTENGTVWVKNNLPGITIPVVETNPVSQITSNGATLSGKITSDGGAAVTERGFLYSINANPTMDSGTKVTVEPATGNFTTTLSGLTESTAYYARAYAINREGVGYGSVESFTTAASSTGEPGNGEPGNGDPGNENPGNGNPGNGNPGNGDTTTKDPNEDIEKDIDSAEKKPNQPTTVTKNIKAAIDKNASATITITDDVIKVLVEKAQADAKAKDKLADGIEVSLNILLKKNADHITIDINSEALDRLEREGVKLFSINTPQVHVKLDAKAVKELRQQTTGNVSIHITSAIKLSTSAKRVIGNRPVYNITISYDKDGKTKYINEFKKGKVMLGIVYLPTDKEKTGNLMGVYINGSGKPVFLPNSSYDKQRLIFTGNMLFTIGVGYKIPEQSFTDTLDHWALKDIDFVVSRGLMKGTTSTTFSPETPVLKATFLMALGKLSGAYVKNYKESSFSDVADTDLVMPYIEWAVANKIIPINDKSEFVPEATITREQMAVIMLNYANAIGYTLPVTREVLNFADIDKISSEAKEAVRAMQQAGIINAKTDNRYDPQGIVTRAEVSVILNRFMKLIIDASTSVGWTQNDSGQWMYYDNYGKYKSGWFTVDNKKYYFNKIGIMEAGKWLQIDGFWYYFYKNGTLAIDTEIDGYVVDSKGVRI